MKPKVQYTFSLATPGLNVPGNAIKLLEQGLVCKKALWWNVNRLQDITTVLCKHIVKCQFKKEVSLLIGIADYPRACPYIPGNINKCFTSNIPKYTKKLVYQITKKRKHSLWVILLPDSRTSLIKNNSSHDWETFTQRSQAKCLTCTW